MSQYTTTEYNSSINRSSIRSMRFAALRRASINATNPEFKKLWSDKLYELAEKYDYDAGIKYADGYKYHPND